jgi:hypothetical protein
MEQLPLPSPIHYELILQLLERQTMSAASQSPELRHKVNQLIITLRKAAAQQKQIEEACKLYSVDIEHRWSINHQSKEVATPD